MRSFVERLLSHPAIAPTVAHHRRVPGRRGRFREPAEPLPRELIEALRARGIHRLYTHQAEALDAARTGKNVLTVTPTASGKTLVFALPVLETALESRGARALFLYPTKALAQDQLAGLSHLAADTGRLRPPSFEIYDGDTPDARRRKIRSDPPDAILTNPDMLHLGILAHHVEWERFLRGLRWIVLDELHVYRGLFGSHVHHILRRLLRLARRLGADPHIVAASATVGNPGEFALRLTGEPFVVIETSGAPRAARQVVLLNPVAVSPYTVATRVVAEAAGEGLRTIAFTKARRVTELLHTWLVRQSPALRTKVAPYRAGYLPEERRAIEARLFRGDLLAVLTTSALELGIDVGGLDVCVLVGYPGSMTSTWQRIGRVGRQDREALVVLVAFPDALDQYLVAHPDLFFGGRFERAVLDPSNPVVSGLHMVCAAAEEPLSREEIVESGGAMLDLAASLEVEGRLRRDAEGLRYFSFRRRPHRDVHPRSAGPPYTIVEASSGRPLGTIDGVRVFHECHPEAVYLHGGQSYRIVALDTDARRVEAVPADVDYFTVVLGEKETEILERLEIGSLGDHATGLGRLKVTLRIREYQKRRLFGAEPISTHPLTAPPLVFETVGFWLELPREAPSAFAARGLHFMGGIHAVEHAMIGLFPLLAIADRGDIGGISYTGHPQIGKPAVFVYDGVPGGAGLAEQGFRDMRRLLESTRDHVAACPCEAGCPACIQSPRCGNGNKPLDKGAALLALAVWLGQAELEGSAESAEGTAPAVSLEPPPRARRHGITRGLPAETAPPPSAGERTLVFDLETQRGADEVGGWGNAARMGLAIAVVYDVERDAWRAYGESEVDRLLLDLAMADCVVGFNIDRFDLVVLSAYTHLDLRRIRTLDLLAEVKSRLGFRVSLGHLAEVNLGETKSADGLKSLKWWKEGRRDLVEAYCRKDVEVTRRLWELGRDRGYLLYRDREGRALRVPCTWSS